MRKAAVLLVASALAACMALLIVNKPGGEGSEVILCDGAQGCMQPSAIPEYTITCSAASPCGKKNLGKEGIKRIKKAMAGAKKSLAGARRLARDVKAETKSQAKAVKKMKSTFKKKVGALRRALLKKYWRMKANFKKTLKGLHGRRGPTGKRGPRGYRGRTSKRGPKGKTGRKGLRGIPGRNGATGRTGPKGQLGKTGATGPRGSVGKKGRTGKSGSRGPKGFRGPRGHRGPRGPRGLVRRKLGNCGKVGGKMYKGICLKSSRLSRNADKFPSSCRVYQPSKKWSQGDYSQLCKMFRINSKVRCDRIDKDADGGRCSNFKAVMGFEQNSHPDVWVHSSTFSFKPARGRQNCRIQNNGGGKDVAVYACRM